MVINEVTKKRVYDDIERLFQQGVRYKIMTKEEAAKILINEIDIDDLEVYLSNFERHVEGKYKGQLIHADFAHLVMMYDQDQKIKTMLFDLLTCVERLLKLKHIQIIESYNTNCDELISSFIHRDNDAHSSYIYNTFSNISTEKQEISYLMKKYNSFYKYKPFVKIASFGTLTRLNYYLGKTYKNEAIINETYLLKDCVSIRNICAHGAPLIENIYQNSTRKLNSSIKIIFKIDNKHKKFIRKMLRFELPRKFISMMFMLHKYKDKEVQNKIEILHNELIDYLQVINNSGISEQYCSIIQFFKIILDNFLH